MIDMEIGSICCNCRIERKISSGSYGTVYLATDDLGGKVALKICPWGETTDRELRGLETYYRKCTHPNLIKILAVEKNPGRFVAYTMEAADHLPEAGSDYCPDTLANRLKYHKSLPPEQVLGILIDLLDALETLHGENLVHRDIKPDNILFLHGKAVLGDPGLIAPAGNNSLIGTPGFLSENRLHGNPAMPRDDFYALGKVIYCALTGNSAECYPKWPTAQTITGYSQLYRVIRFCINGKANTADAVRQILDTPGFRPVFNWRWFLVIALSLLLLFAAGALLWNLHSSPTPPPLMQESIDMPESTSEGKISHQTSTSPKTKELLKISKSTAVNSGIELLQSRNFFAEDHLDELLNYTYLDLDKMMTMMAANSPHPRIRQEYIPMQTEWQSYPGHLAMIRIKSRACKTAESSALLKDIMATLDRFDPDCFWLDMNLISARQKYWRTQPGSGKEKQFLMLNSDSVMLAVALDLAIRNLLNEIIASGATHLSNKQAKELSQLYQIKANVHNIYMLEKEKSF